MPLDYADKYDVAGDVSDNILGTVKNFALATAVDTGTTFWNSLPFVPEVRTQDLLAKVSDDALQLFNEHPDAVRTASMIGGAFIPGGITMKLMGRARAGIESVGYVREGLGAGVINSMTGQRQRIISTEIEKIFAESGNATSQYKSLTRQLYAANIGREVLDNAIIEGMVVGTMNAHPYMEDYLKDPLQNFGTGVLIGGVLGTAFSIPATRKAIINLTGDIAESSITDILKSGYSPVFQKDMSMTESSAVQRHTANIQILDDLIINKDTTGLTREIASSYRISEAAQRANAIERAAPWSKDMNDDVKNAVLTIMQDTKYAGVDKIRYYDLNKSVKETAKTAHIVQDADIKELTALGIKPNSEMIASTFLTPDNKPAIAFVRLSTGETFGAKGARNAGLAVDIKTIKTDLASATQGQNKTVVTNPRQNFAEDNLFRQKSSASVDAEFLIELKRMDSVDVHEIPNITIAPDHLPRMNAVLSKFGDLTPEEQAKVKIRFKNEYPTHDQVQRYVTQKVEAGGMGVSPDYFKLLDKVVYEKQVDLGMYNKVGPRNQTMLSNWQRSPDKAIRDNLEAYLTHSGAGDHTLGKELYDAGAQFRAEMRKLADPEGNVILYRAMGGVSGRGVPATHRFVEGYSNRPLKQFGKPEAYKVHVDNIVGVIGSGAYKTEAEILVTSARHDVVDPNQIGVVAKVEHKAEQIDVPVQPTTTNESVSSLYKIYADTTTSQIKNMIESKIMSFEEISARTNTTPDAVKAVYAGHELADYPAEWRRYSDVKKIDDVYLHPKNKLYAVLGNPDKNPMSGALASLDNKALSVAHQQIMEQMTLQSGSKIGNDMLTFLGTPEMKLQLEQMNSSIAQLNNVKTGDVRFQSADQALRNAVAGPTVTFIGKQVIDQVDKMKKTLLEPLAAHFAPFKDRPELFTEFNTVTNKLYGMKGWRDLQIDEATGYGYLVQRSGSGKGVIETPVRNKDGTTFYIKQPEVLSALQATQNVSGEMLQLHNLLRGVSGRPPVNDLGFYLPPINLVGKTFAYVFDHTGKEGTKLIVANKADELETAIQSFKKINSDAINKGDISITTKGQQADYNIAAGFADADLHVTYADNAAFHTGSSQQAIVPSDERFIENIMQGYENLTVQGYRRYTEMYMSDTMAWLDKLSGYYQKNVVDQPKSGIFKEKTKDSALAVKNILLGRDQLESSVGLKAVNSMTDLLYNRASAGINAVVKSFQSEKVGSKEFFDSLNATLKSKGVDAPWKSFDEYLSTTVAETRNIAPAIQSAGNGLLATLNLRMFEVAQAAMNIMSLPILTWSALMEKLPGTMINSQGSMVKLPLEVMINGMKHMWSEEGKALDKVWEAAGLLKQTTRQYTEVTAALKGASQGKEFMDKAVEFAGKLQQNKIVKDYLSKPADFAEELTRKYAMHTGYLAAKQAYPGIDDTAATIAATAFADRSIGNYHAAQRPAMFQGTFGAAIGLYQTYVLTYAQSIYRSLENRNFKQLAALAISQSGLFGISSLPGYHTLSEQVVGHISDQHIDLTTGTYRAIEDHAARLVLYGLPSSLGAAFYTRGDVNPRIPSSMGEIAVFNGLKQGYAAATSIIQKTGEGMASGNGMQSMMEALSLQSLNRPMARWAELVSGASITTKYNTMSPASEIFTPMGVFARMIGTRPLEEQVTRDTLRLNRYYEALDHDRREEVVDKLATAIRNNKVEGDLVSKVAGEYLRAGGKADGWRSALNKTLLTTEQGTRLTLLRKLEGDDPLQMMIRDMY